MPDQDVVWNLRAKTWARASLSFEFCKGKEGRKKKVLGDPNMDVDVDVDQRPKVADNRVNSISEARPPAKQQKKIVIPAIISTSLLHSSLRVKKRAERVEADLPCPNSHPDLDGLFNQCNFI